MDFKIGKYIQKGNFGRIYRAKNDETKVIKIIKKKNLQIDLYKEIQILQILQSDFVVKFFNWKENEKNIVQLLEYIPGGDLFDKINSKEISDTLIIDYIKQITLGINFIHKKKIIHRDIKPENILVDQKGKIKIIDLGLATFFKENKKKYKILGTPYYMAPEMLNEIGYDHRIDIWGIGLIFYELVFGGLPFTGETKEEVFNEISEFVIFFPKDNPHNDILNKILTKDPNHRITCLDILSSI